MKRYTMLSSLAMALFFIAFFCTSCNDEAFSDATSGDLAFSVDTLTFDTVFTTVGTTTRQLRVYNVSGRDLRLSSVALAGGRASRFRVNVDGDTALVARNVEILAGDSIFIFVQACINPNEQNSPFLVEDSILFGNGQRVVLSAWGRNAIYHRALQVNGVAHIDCAGWDHNRPHVIIGTVVVDSLNTLTLNEGDEIYMAAGALLAVDAGGSIEIRGSAARPVLITSIRHDGWYDTLPGQWNALWLSPGSVNNVIDHAVIENGTLGIVVDTNVNAHPTLEMSNCVVRQMSHTGIMGRGAYVKMRNVLIYQCGTATLWWRYGGRYEVAQSTLAGYWHYGGRSNPEVVLNNWYTSADGQTVLRPLLQADFVRCIIYGTYPQTEVLIDSNSAAEMNYRFSESHVKGVTSNDDPQFEAPLSGNFRLKAGSVAEGLGYQYDN
ncbi:MAG: hypothetical protein IJ761_03540 [Bacteroidales bacterium]|nr:hypothetical protein [Bacteroidales bacterium]